MDKKIVPEAESDVKSLSEDVWLEIKTELNSITHELSHNALKVIDNPMLDYPVWQLTVNGASANHRVFLDIDQSKLVVLAVWSFEFTHNGDRHWRELSSRL